MATFVELISWTDQGIRNVKDTAKRADTVREMAKKYGAEQKDLYWTLGAYDAVAIFEAPDDVTMTTLAMAISAQGFVRTQTLRAFSKDEVNGILRKL